MKCLFLCYFACIKKLTFYLFWGHFHSLYSAKSHSQSSPTYKRPVWGKIFSTEEPYPLMVADFQGTNIPTCWLKISFSHEPKRAHLWVVIECSTFPPIFRALLMPWAPVNDCRWTPIAGFHLAVENNSSHISYENPTPNNIIVKLNTVHLGEVWNSLQINHNLILCHDIK